MSKVYFISHPEVVVDKSIPITEWGLSSVGQERLEQLFRKPWIHEIGSIYSSKEKKAIIAAERIAAKLNLSVNFLADLGEMDRSSTGFLEPTEFEKTVDAFFANPNQSIRGWESAINAQHRIVTSFENILKENKENKDIVIVSHGGVGSLLMSFLKEKPISRREEQPGQGYYFSIDRDSRKLLQSWQSIS